MRPSRLAWAALAIVLLLGALASHAPHAAAAPTGKGKGPAKARDTEAYVGDLKQALGRAKLLAQGGKAPEAVALIDTMTADLAAWRRLLLGSPEDAAADKEAADAAAEAEAAIDYVMADVVFSINTTHMPKRCKRRTAEGNTLRVHFIGKLLATQVIFDSSFHTGSMPVKLTLGDPSNLEGWNAGLLDMCEGERRTLTLPGSMAWGAEGRKGVPANAAVTYHMELVEFSQGRAQRRAAAAAAADGDGDGDGDGAKRKGKAARKAKARAKKAKAKAKAAGGEL